MLSRILTAAIATALAALAIGLPIMLTEAGNSSSSGEGKTLNAAFSYVDGATGDQYYVTVYASEATFTYRDSGGSDGGGGGSHRANSGRAGSSRGGSGGGSGGGPQTYTNQYINVYIDHYDAFGNWVGYADGAGVPNALSIAADLAEGSVADVVEMYAYDTRGNPLDEFELTVDLDFNATGALETSRDRFTFHTRSPRQRYSQMTTNTRRAGDATGEIRGSGGPNLADGGSYYAEIGTFTQKTSSSN